MAMCILGKGQKFEKGGVSYMLVKRQKSGEWLAEEERTGEGILLPEAQLLEGYAKGTVRLIHSGPHPATQEPCRPPAQRLSELPPAVRAEVKRRYAVCKSIDSMRRTEKCCLRMVGRATRAVWPRSESAGRPPHPSTAWRWFQRYRDSGCDVAALVPRHNSKGCRARRYPDEVIRIVRRALDEVYLTRQRETRKATLERATYLVREENKLRPRNATLPLPTMRLVVREIERLDAYEVVRRRYGAEEARRRFRTALRSTVGSAPLERVEADHARLDVILVDVERGLVLGRPWLTVFIDTCTRCVLGFFLSFSSPSYISVVRALRHAILPKTDLHERFPGITNNWECYGTPLLVYVDNGLEFHSTHLENALYHVNCELAFQPRRTPWWKGVVERFFREVNGGLVHRLEGTTFSHVLDRGDYDSEAMATVTLPDLEWMLTKWIVDVYHEDIHSELLMTPAQAWRQRIPEVAQPLPDRPEQLDAFLGQTLSDRRLDHRGVTLEHLWYNSPALTDIRNRLGDVLQVDVTYDPDDMGAVHVMDPEHKVPIRVPARNQEYAAGLPLAAHKLIRNHAVNEGRSAANMTGLLKSKNELREMVQECAGRRVGTRRRKGKGAASAPCAQPAAGRGNGQDDAGPHKAKPSDTGKPSGAEKRPSSGAARAPAAGRDGASRKPEGSVPLRRIASEEHPRHRNDGSGRSGKE